MNIHYSKNRFNYEVIEKSHALFKRGPFLGFRAPNAPVNASSLFVLLKNTPFNILYFQTKKDPVNKFKEKIDSFIENYPYRIKIHFFVLSSVNKVLFKRYNVTSSAIYVIRPDGYVGFRINSDNYLLLEGYLKIFFNKKSDKFKA